MRIASPKPKATMIRTMLRRIRSRLAQADTGSDFLDACCHRIGGQLRAGPPKAQP